MPQGGTIFVLELGQLLNSFWKFEKKQATFVRTTSTIWEKDREIITQQPISIVIVDVHLYKIFWILDFVAALKFVRLLNVVQKVGKSGHIVCTISLRCYKILMQPFMILYSRSCAPM